MALGDSQVDREASPDRCFTLAVLAVFATVRRRLGRQPWCASPISLAAYAGIQRGFNDAVSKGCSFPLRYR